MRILINVKSTFGDVIDFTPSKIILKSLMSLIIYHICLHSAISKHKSRLHEDLDSLLLCAKHYAISRCFLEIVQDRQQVLKYKDHMHSKFYIENLKLLTKATITCQYEDHKLHLHLHICILENCSSSPASTYISISQLDLSFVFELGFLLTVQKFHQKCHVD